MNQDHAVDELLKDLDAALSVEPSPAAMARVRSRIAEQPAPGPMRVWWFAAAAAVIVVGLGVALWWPRSVPAVDRHPPQVSQSAPPVVAPVPSPPQLRQTVTAPTTSRAPVAVSRRATRVTPVSVPLVERRDFEVLVSPSIRLAMQQLDAATRAGRITAESFSRMDAPTSLDMVTFQPVVIDIVKVDAPVATGGGATR